MVCVLIPCHNEEESISAVIRAAATGLNAFDDDAKQMILVVNNASTDNTENIAFKTLEKLSNISSAIINEPTLGYGSAIQAGIRYIHNNLPDVDFIIIADGDATYDLSDLNAFKIAREKGYQFVIGVRKYIFSGGIRAIGANLLSLYGRILSGSKVKDFHCGLRGGDAKTLYCLNCQSSGFEYASEMVINANTMGVSAYQFPTAYSPAERKHMHSKSKLNPIIDGIKHVFLITKLACRREDTVCLNEYPDH